MGARITRLSLIGSSVTFPNYAARPYQMIESGESWLSDVSDLDSLSTFVRDGSDKLELVGRDFLPASDLSIQHSHHIVGS